MACPVPDQLVEARLDRVLTQYRESPKLLHLMRTYLRQVEDVYRSVCDLPSFFDIGTAVGDQLTLIGKRLGFPRCHCVCNLAPVVGFACSTDEFDRPIVGFCEGGTWISCGEDGTSEICITDDEMYRALLRARRYQILRRYKLADLTTAVQGIYGSTAQILDAGRGRVVIAPFRALSQQEELLLKVVPRVLPIAPGIAVRYHFGTFKVAGFGDGWGGFCEETAPGSPDMRGADWMCPINVKPYSC